MKTYSARSLVATYRAARAGQHIATGDWVKPSLSPDEFREWFRDCLERKISSQDARQIEGRKTGDEYQTELKRLRRYVGNRVVVDWIAPVLGARVQQAMAHRMRDET